MSRLGLCLILGWVLFLYLVEAGKKQDKTEVDTTNSKNPKWRKTLQQQAKKPKKGGNKRRKIKNASRRLKSGKKSKKNKANKNRPKNRKNKQNKNKNKVKSKKARNRKNRKTKKSKKKKNKKSKLSKRKKKPRGTRKKNRQSSTCSQSGDSPVSDQCLADALISLIYEGNQVTNYLKQSKRLENHGKISSNKLTKKDEFESAARHMLWAIGGNISDPKCGETTNDTKRMAFLKRGLSISVANYNDLMNCSNAIKAACDIEQHNSTYNKSEHSESMTECQKYKNDFINVSKECISKKDQTNATLQCDCWSRAAKDVAIIKKLKCETKKNQKIVTAHKNACIKVFGTCKKLEDAAVELIHTCMHDHSNEFINQTAESLNEAAEKAGRKEFQKRLAFLGIDSMK